MQGHIYNSLYYIVALVNEDGVRLAGDHTVNSWIPVELILFVRFYSVV